MPLGVHDVVEQETTLEEVAMALDRAVGLGDSERTVERIEAGVGPVDGGRGQGVAAEAVVILTSRLIPQIT
jgi:hypothetical protein